MDGECLVDKRIFHDIRFWPEGGLYVNNRGTVYVDHDSDHYKRLEPVKRVRGGKECLVVEYTGPVSGGKEEIEIYVLTAMLFCKKGRASGKVNARNGNYKYAAQKNLYWDGQKDDPFLSREEYESLFSG